MIKEAIEYVVGLAKPSLINVDGWEFSDKKLFYVNHNPKADAIKMNTLTSLVDYIKSNVDAFAEKEKMIIHIKNATCIQLYSSLDYEREREYLVEVNSKTPNFMFNQFIGHESFCINVQSKALDDPETDKALLLKFAGTVESGSVAEYGDDGITQKATVKNGIASKSEAIVPNPVKLKLFRTFLEVEQPVSNFIFRMKQGSCNDIQCALYEADGGAWEIEAMNEIKAYLSEELKDFPNFIILS